MLLMCKYHWHMPVYYRHNCCLSYEKDNVGEQDKWTGITVFTDENSPFGAVISGGHAEELPVQYSAVSHFWSLEGRQIWSAGAKLQASVQQGLLLGSHNAPFLNLQVWTSQQLELTPGPGSQSSPASTMPLPHICNETVFLAWSGSTRQVVFTRPPVTPPMTEPSKNIWRQNEDNENGCLHIFPTLHGEKFVSPNWETGSIMKRPSAEQTSELKGQQGGFEEQMPLH